MGKMYFALPSIASPRDVLRDVPRKEGKDQVAVLPYRGAGERLFGQRGRFVDLVRNACEAMDGRDRRELTISRAYAKRGFVTVSVTDCGWALAAAALDDLFKPFVTTKKQGMGVGLSICQTIIHPGSNSGPAFARTCARGNRAFTL
jgi:light-regulated signal transduction histidine kinase (bacteriophytochrome)